MRAFLFSVAALLLFSVLPAQEPPPDAVFLGGKILTVDAGFTVREAFAVRGGKIVAVGTTAEIRRLAQPGKTSTHELGGQM
ncbi:MAG: amidohydrolase, partial [Verrucomicrobiota bacterium]